MTSDFADGLPDSKRRECVSNLRDHEPFLVKSTVAPFPAIRRLCTVL